MANDKSANVYMQSHLTNVYEKKVFSSPLFNHFMGVFSVVVKNRANINLVKGPTRSVYHAV